MIGDKERKDFEDYFDSYEWKEYSNISEEDKLQFLKLIMDNDLEITLTKTKERQKLEDY